MSWVAKCQSYDAANMTRVTTGLASMLGSYTAGVAQITELEQMH